ncbi:MULTISPECIES: gp16 family protein [unclassified Mesorhizobium]|uniref:gp16 family protein n=1 Tax=unclassified Mesorhizobium TaxID=325217 RepID=UPI000A6086DD|nr:MULTISPECIES: regulatory protein GemA [unclassified Mesorhizobium]
MTALAAIHVARKQLGLDEDTYRAVLVRVTGKTSAGDMTEAERQQVLGAFREHGFKPAKVALDGPFAKKLQALWIAGWNLGLVRDRRDSAMLAFVARVTGIEHTRFLRNAADARKAIEALKSWTARAGVDWSDGEHMTAWLRGPGGKIARAQWTLLNGGFDFASFKTFVEDHAFNPINQMTAREWAGVMNTLGERIRKMVP